MSVPVAPPPPTDLPESMTRAAPELGFVAATNDRKAPVSNASNLPALPAPLMNGAAGAGGGAAAAAAPVAPAAPTPTPPAAPSAAAPKSASELPSFEPALANIQAIPTKKLLMVVNTFVLNSTDFINKFAAQAERKLSRVAKNVQRLEIMLSLLESKLDSIKYINDGSAPAAAPGSAAAAGAPAAPQAPGAPGAPPGGAAPEGGADNKHAGGAGAGAAAPKAEEPPAMKLKDDPRFANYFKLLRLQVPKEQIRQKLVSDGYDGAVIDRDPEGPTVPGAPSVALVPAEGGDDDSASDEGS